VGSVYLTAVGLISDCSGPSCPSEYNGISTFDANSYVELGTPSSLGIYDSSFTMMAWVKPADGKWDHECIFCGGGGGSTRKTMHFTMHVSHGNRMGFYGSDCDTGSLPSATEWSHVAYTYVKNGDMKIYFNGVEVKSCANKSSYLGTNPIYAGRSASGTYSSTGFHGDMAGVEVYGGVAKSAAFINDRMGLSATHMPTLHPVRRR
jgi:hypothetical protein